MPNYKLCVDGYNKTRKECTDWRDEGYERCDEWGKDCVNWARECVLSWIPFIGPAICKVFEWVCRGFQWVCTAAVWIAHMVCHAWNVVTTFVCTAWETVTFVVSIVGIFVKAILSIPIIGAIIRQFINLITSIVIGVIGFAVEGVFCGLLGICLPKKMRVCVIIAHDGTAPITTPAAIQPILARTQQIYEAEANVIVDVTFGEGRAPNVEPSCGFDGWIQDFGLPGTQYEHSASLHCMGYSVGSVIGIASPIYAIAVRDIEGSSNGCSLGPLANYVLFEAGSTCAGNTHLAHEIGHACNLTHVDDDTTNLMTPSCVTPGRDQLTRLEKVIVRGSKYVTYF